MSEELERAKQSNANKAKQLEEIQAKDEKLNVVAN